MSLYGRSGLYVDKVGFYWGRGGGTGSWQAIRNCVGCGTGRFKTEECSKREGSSSNQLTRDWSISVSREISAGFEFLGLNLGKLSITGSYSEQTVTRTES